MIEQGETVLILLYSHACVIQFLQKCITVVMQFYELCIFHRISTTKATMIERRKFSIAYGHYSQWHLLYAAGLEPRGLY